MSLPRKLRTFFFRLSAADQLSIIAVLPLAVAVELGLRIFLLPTLARLAGAELAKKAEPPTHAPFDLLPSEARLVRATTLVFRNWPFQGACLRQSLVLGFLLRSRKPVLQIGVAREDGALQAHAWIEVQGAPVGDPRAVESFARLGRVRSDVPGERAAESHSL
jgi:transglutaminase superfamily protein